MQMCLPLSSLLSFPFLSLDLHLAFEAFATLTRSSSLQLLRALRRHFSSPPFVRQQPFCEREGEEEHPVPVPVVAPLEKGRP